MIAGSNVDANTGNDDAKNNDQASSGHLSRWIRI